MHSFVLSTEQQAGVLRRLTGASNSLDIEHLALELAYLGKWEVRDVENCIKLMLLHGLKIMPYPTGLDVLGWQSEILDLQRSAIAAFAPSMWQLIDAEKARLSAVSMLPASFANPLG